MSRPITQKQWNVLQALKLLHRAKSIPPTLKELKAETGIRQNSLSRMLQQMEENGHVQRIEGAGWRRWEAAQ